MALLKPINKPSLLLPYEEMYIQNFRRNNELISEQHPNEHNPMFEHLQHAHRPHTGLTTNHLSAYLSVHSQPVHDTAARRGQATHKQIAFSVV
jgi:hypothetical protein